MCTVTIIPRHGASGETVGLRLACNRDELRTRPPAEPPRIVERGEHRAILPIDPTSGGTWIAVNDAGIVATLLNRNLTDQRDKTRRVPLSRGEIIPGLLDIDELDCARERVLRLNPADYEPFRLVIADANRAVTVTSDGGEFVRRDTPLQSPIMFTSSGLGDHLVEPPRTRLFAEWFGVDAGAWPAEQDAFHRHRWPDRPELSVCMSRADARTVSLTVVEVDADMVRMTYHGAPPDVDAPLQGLALARRGASVA